MPAGDAQRVWFPEMIEELKKLERQIATLEELKMTLLADTEKRRRSGWPIRISDHEIPWPRRSSSASAYAAAP